ncbi:general odorant-binding protein 19d-like [Sitodiplosis mosellana]|uniref:general odorant-binding protein 19d-like n=1 Tax=Sitodiplosis mosellana TaxID=263140 RepID=UPI00244394A1|nr:general odorant-binding protein 19d-like [Sitodiplosis mosellana]
MNSIKLLGLIFAVFVIALVTDGAEPTKEQKEMCMAISEDCRKSNGATEEDGNNLCSGKMPETKTAKCTASCVMKQFKLAKKNGANLEADCDVMAQLAEAKGANATTIAAIKDICGKCKAPGTPDDCEFSAMIATCIKKECEARGITVDSIQ